MRPHVPTSLLALCLSVAIGSALAQEYTFGQATWYDSIKNGWVADCTPCWPFSEMPYRHVSTVLGFQQAERTHATSKRQLHSNVIYRFCGFGSNIPEFVGALPFIETNRNGAGFWQPPAQNPCSDLCYEVSCVPQFVESSNGEIYLDRR